MPSFLTDFPSLDRWFTRSAIPRFAVYNGTGKTNRLYKHDEEDMTEAMMELQETIELQGKGIFRIELYNSSKATTPTAVNFMKYDGEPAEAIAAIPEASAVEADYLGRIGKLERTIEMQQIRSDYEKRLSDKENAHRQELQNLRLENQIKVNGLKSEQFNDKHKRELEAVKSQKLSQQIPEIAGAVIPLLQMFKVNKEQTAQIASNGFNESEEVTPAKKNTPAKKAAPAGKVANMNKVVYSAQFIHKQYPFIDEMMNDLVKGFRGENKEEILSKLKAFHESIK